jgi:hypothetical protein
MAGNTYHTIFYIGGLMLLAASLPLSPFMVTVSQVILLLNWVIEGDLKNKLFKVWKRKSLFFFLLIMAVHIIWLIPSQDLQYAMNDLKIKLPLLVLPLVLGTGRGLRENEVKMILLMFTGGVIISSFFSIYRLATIASIPMFDQRDISVFISHIRLSLLVNVAIFSLIYLLTTGSFQWQRILRNGLWVSLGWLIFFLFILQSITGIIVFIVTGILFLFMFSQWFENQYWYIRKPLLYGITAFSFMVIIYSFVVMLSFFRKPVAEDELKSLTPSGNPYEHHTLNRQIENGSYVWINISENELRQEWNRKSSIDYNGRDLKGHEIKTTLIRYLTSLGLDKNANGILQLSETDILNIEQGMANHIYQYNKWLYPRIYQIIWEIDNYRKGGNPSGHSFAQRFEYWKAAMGIIRNNFWFGVGTGDVRAAFDYHYATSDTRLAPEWQLRAHNQFLTFMISFGITGFLIVAAGMCLPLYIEKRYQHILPFVFFSIAILSMLTEDTLETQAGATFFAFFYSLFIFAHNKIEPDETEWEN